MSADWPYPLQALLSEFQLPKLACGDCLTCDPGLKCCTFFPIFPNYLVGELLSSPWSSLVETWIAERGTPLGVGPSQAYIQEFSQSPFGSKAELLCPFYNKTERSCGIYQSRPAVCATYFCRQMLPMASQQSLDITENKAQQTENTLAYLTALELGYLDPELKACDALMQQGKSAAHLWHSLSDTHVNSAQTTGDTADQPTELLAHYRRYYLSCAQYIKGLSYSQIKALVES